MELRMSVSRRHHRFVPPAGRAIVTGVRAKEACRTAVTLFLTGGGMLAAIGLYVAIVSAFA
jgi:hypothetical protein